MCRHACHEIITGCVTFSLFLAVEKPTVVVYETRNVLARAEVNSGNSCHREGGENSPVVDPRKRGKRHARGRPPGQNANKRAGVVTVSRHLGSESSRYLLPLMSAASLDLRAPCPGMCVGLPYPCQHRAAERWSRCYRRRPSSLAKTSAQATPLKPTKGAQTGHVSKSVMICSYPQEVSPPPSKH